MQAYVPAADAAAFDRSRARLETVIGWLADAATDEAGHAEVEQRLQAEAREVFRQLLQDHLDLRAVREQPVAAVTGRDGITRRYVEADHDRGLVTVFGKVTVRRLAYRAKGAANLYPADAVLDLPAGLHSHGLARLAAIESARGSFAAAQQAIERATGVRVGKRQVERVQLSV